MTHNQRSNLLALLLTVLLCVPAGVLIGSCDYPRLVSVEQPTAELQTRGGGITHFDNLSTTDLTVADDLTVTDDIGAADITVTGAIGAADVTTTDDLTVGDDLIVTGNVTLQSLAVLSTTNLAVTTATITPTVSAYHADSAGNVTWTLPACSVNGQLLLLYGDDANTITIADAALRSTDGNAVTIGQFDLVLLVCFDTEWVHLAKSANS